MLRFNVGMNLRLAPEKKFQYILCCGSTYYAIIIGGDFLAFQYILCCGSTGTVSFDSFVCALFQYILCCGST